MQSVHKKIPRPSGTIHRGEAGDLVRPSNTCVCCGHASISTKWTQDLPSRSTCCVTHGIEEDMATHAHSLELRDTAVTTNDVVEQQISCTSEQKILQKYAYITWMADS